MSDSWFVEISLRRHHTPLVGYAAFSHEIDYVTIFRRFKISKGIKIALLVQELRQFCLLVELQRWRVCYQRGLPHIVIKQQGLAIEQGIFAGWLADYWLSHSGWWVVGRG